MGSGELDGAMVGHWNPSELDGGFFGPLSWAIVMLSEHSMISLAAILQAAAKLLVTGAV